MFETHQGSVSSLDERETGAVSKAKPPSLVGYNKASRETPGSMSQEATIRHVCSETVYVSYFEKEITYTFGGVWEKTIYM